MNTATATAPLWRFAIDDVPVALACAGGIFAAAGAEGTCVVRDPASGSERRLHLDGGLLTASFSPDGAHLVLTGPAGYLLWRRDLAAPTVISGSNWCAAAAWTEGNRIAIAAGRTVHVLATDGQPLWRAAPAPSTITDLTWMRRGRELAITAYNGVYRYARHTEAPVATLSYPGSHLSIAVSPDDKWVCTGNQDASVHLWRVRDGKELQMAGFREKVTRTAFDDTGRWMANNGAPEATVWDFSGRGPGGSKPRMLKVHERVCELAWRPGPAAILATAGAEGQIALWDVPRAREGRDAKPAVAFNLDAPPTALAWADSTQLIAGCRNGDIVCLPAAEALANHGLPVS